MLRSRSRPRPSAREHGVGTSALPERGRGLSHEERQKLLAENLPGVRWIARRIHLRLPPHVPFDDLVHSGVLGLMDALDKFDPQKNVPLKSYAQFRIRGAILDSLRQLDWSPRHLRRVARRIEKVREELIHKLGRLPSELEIAADMGVPLDEFQGIVAELDGLPVGAQLAESDADHVGGAPELRTTEEDPFHLCLRAEMIAILDEAIGTLDHQARQAVALYYFEERTMKEVGTLLNICESRVSQIVTAATAQLRACLRRRLDGKQD